MSKNVITTAKNIRGLQVISPEGVVGVWADKKDDDKFFVAITTKAAGWSEYTNRGALTGPLTKDEMLAHLVSYKKRGEAALKHVATVLADLVIDTPSPVVDADVMVEAQASQRNVEADPLFIALLERAMARPAERNEQLKVEVAAEIEALTVKIEENTDETLAEKFAFNLRRKGMMVEALDQALAAAV
jgi:hypothetical protein